MIGWNPPNSHSFFKIQSLAAVLVAIAIPVFTTQLEKSREATDMSNVRAAYAEVIANYLSNGAKVKTSGEGKTTATVTARQTVSGWQNTENGKLQIRVDGVESTISFDAKKAGSTWTVEVTPSGSHFIKVS